MFVERGTGGSGASRPDRRYPFDKDISLCKRAWKCPSLRVSQPKRKPIPILNVQRTNFMEY